MQLSTWSQFVSIWQKSISDSVHLQGSVKWSGSDCGLCKWKISLELCPSSKHSQPIVFICMQLDLCSTQIRSKRTAGPHFKTQDWSSKDPAMGISRGSTYHHVHCIVQITLPKVSAQFKRKDISFISTAFYSNISFTLMRLPLDGPPWESQGQIIPSKSTPNF